MGDAAPLITAIAALVTAIGSSVAGILLALAALSRQRAAAAKEAQDLTRRHLGEPDEPPAPHRHRAPRRPLPGADEAVEHARSVAREAAQLAGDTRRDDRLDHLEQQERERGGTDA